MGRLGHGSSSCAMACFHAHIEFPETQNFGSRMMKRWMLHMTVIQRQGLKSGPWFASRAFESITPCC